MSPIAAHTKIDDTQNAVEADCPRCGDVIGFLPQAYVDARETIELKCFRCGAITTVNK